MTWTPMASAIETPRLTLRMRDERDAAWYRELVAERGEETPTMREATARLARFRDLTVELGIGALAIDRRAEGDTIGYCALIVGRASLDEPEIAYELLKRYHGHGYATEAAQALVEAAAATGRRRLWSTVGAWNEPSLRVLEKVGFRRDHTVMTDDRGEIVYLVRDLYVSSLAAAAQMARYDARAMDQPRQIAALGHEPIQTIDRVALKEKLDQGDAVKLIMALNRWAFEAKHIPGSIHFDTPEALYAAVQPDDEVVVYCSHVDCLSSVAMYRDLVRRGYRNVRRYSGGLLDWEDAGLPLEGEMATLT